MRKITICIVILMVMVFSMPTLAQEDDQILLFSCPEEEPTTNDEYWPKFYGEVTVNENLVGFYRTTFSQNTNFCVAEIGIAVKSSNIPPTFDGRTENIAEITIIETGDGNVSIIAKDENFSQVFGIASNLGRSEYIFELAEEGLRFLSVEFENGWTLVPMEGAELQILEFGPQTEH